MDGGGGGGTGAGESSTTKEYPPQHVPPNGYFMDPRTAKMDEAELREAIAAAMNNGRSHLRDDELDDLVDLEEDNGMIRRPAGYSPRSVILPLIRVVVLVP